MTENDFKFIFAEKNICNITYYKNLTNMFLNFIVHKKRNFTFDFFQNNTFHSYIQQINNRTNNKGIFNDNYCLEPNAENTIHEIKFIPSYFDLQYNDLPPLFKLIKFKRVEQFQINLKEYSDVDSYLKSQMRPKSRSQLRSRIVRLEQCFEIQYKFYYGEISKPEYDDLFLTFELFIKRRFQQRGGFFALKNRWDFIKKSSYEMILNKKASLFVIYCDEKPIDICLNFHFQNIMHHLIRSYDIDYSKFQIGQIDIYKQIEWCFNNGFVIFDLMWGELLYKIRWSNEIKKYEHYFIYKNNQFKTLIVRLMIELYKINDFLKKKKIYKLFHLTKVNFNKIFQSKSEIDQPILQKENVFEMPINDNITKINIHSEEYSFLRKPVYDFQYLNCESKATINVFKINNLKNTYIITGTEQKIKINISYKQRD